MNKNISNKRIIRRFLMAIIVLGLFLFWPAGTFWWLEAWLFIIIYLSWAVFMLRWLKKNNPALMEKRLSAKLSSKGWDRVFTIVSTIFFAIMFVIYGLDAVRFQWSNVPLFLKIFGFMGVFFTLYVVFLIMKENTYLARVVEIQKGQKVISTGPYRVVRHPMYAAFMLMFYCLSLALGSWYSLIPATLMNISVIVRTILEDKTLHKELKGYPEYAQKVKYKLIPGVW